MLGEFWLRELTLARVEQLGSTEIATALSAFEWSLPQVTDGDVVEKLEQLQIDYCQLLIGPKATFRRLNLFGPLTSFSHSPLIR